MSQLAKLKEDKTPPSKYVYLITAVLILFFIVVILIDRYTNYSAIETTSYGYYKLEENTIIWVGIVILVAMGFYGVGVVLYDQLKPDITEVKKIDYVWYVGSALGLILSLLDFQGAKSQTNRIIYQSSLITSHAALRAYCSESDRDIAYCQHIDPLLYLEGIEILEIINTGSSSGIAEDSPIKSIDDIKNIASDLYGGSFGGELLNISIEALVEEDPLTNWKIFNSGKAWFLIFASILGIRLSKTYVEVNY
jgi:succinate dehydrogenase/fumarate reductase cytochrome b subunit